MRNTDTCYYLSITKEENSAFVVSNRSNNNQSSSAGATGNSNQLYRQRTLKQLQENFDRDRAKNKKMYDEIASSANENSVPGSAGGSMAHLQSKHSTDKMCTTGEQTKLLNGADASDAMSKSTQCNESTSGAPLERESAQKKMRAVMERAKLLLRGSNTTDDGCSSERIESGSVVTKAKKLLRGSESANTNIREAPVREAERSCISENPGDTCNITFLH